MKWVIDLMLLSRLMVIKKSWTLYPAQRRSPWEWSKCHPLTTCKQFLCRSPRSFGLHQLSGFTRELLPPCQDYIAILRVKFDHATFAIGLLASNKGAS